MQRRCGHEKLACTAFEVYVETGRAYLPQSVLSVSGGVVAELSVGEHPAPTRAIYAGMARDGFEQTRPSSEVDAYVARALASSDALVGVLG
jgi:hypothetical protein